MLAKSSTNGYFRDAFFKKIDVVLGSKRKEHRRAAGVQESDCTVALLNRKEGSWFRRQSPRKKEESWPTVCVPTDGENCGAFDNVVMHVTTEFEAIRVSPKKHSCYSRHTKVLKL